MLKAVTLLSTSRGPMHVRRQPHVIQQSLSSYVRWTPRQQFVGFFFQNHKKRIWYNTFWYYMPYVTLKKCTKILIAPQKEWVDGTRGFGIYFWGVDPMWCRSYFLHSKFEIFLTQCEARTEFSYLLVFIKLSSDRKFQKYLKYYLFTNSLLNWRNSKRAANVGVRNRDSHEQILFFLLLSFDKNTRKN